MLSPPHPELRLPGHITNPGVDAEDGFYLDALKPVFDADSSSDLAAVLGGYNAREDGHSVRIALQRDLGGGGFSVTGCSFHKLLLPSATYCPSG